MECVKLTKIALQLLKLDLQGKRFGLLIALEAKEHKLLDTYAGFLLIYKPFQNMQPNFCYDFRAYVVVLRPNMKSLHSANYPKLE